jgi:hypothetical protein
MRQGGFYGADVAPGTRLLALNTVFWSSYWTNESLVVPPVADPAGQMAWLAGELEAARVAGKRCAVRCGRTRAQSEAAGAA